jgi:hypothetical protein
MGHIDACVGHSHSLSSLKWVDLDVTHIRVDVTHFGVDVTHFGVNVTHFGLIFPIFKKMSHFRGYYVVLCLKADDYQVC